MISQVRDDFAPAPWMSELSSATNQPLRRRSVVAKACCRLTAKGERVNSHDPPLAPSYTFAIDETAIGLSRPGFTVQVAAGEAAYRRW
jgi:hypothetical protein